MPLPLITSSLVKMHSGDVNFRSMPKIQDQTRSKKKIYMKMVEKSSSLFINNEMEGEGNGGAGGPAPLAQRKVYRGRRTTEMNQIDESMLILPREEGIHPTPVTFLLPPSFSGV